MFEKLDWKKQWPPSKWMEHPEWQAEFVRASCLISEKHKFIFIHIAKNAGMSMARGVFMKEVEDAVNSPNLDQPLDHPKWDDYFKFAFVRNPWDRMVSCFKYQIHGLYKGDTFEEFLKEYAWDENGDPTNKHWLDQYLHLHSFRTNKCFVNYIGKFENLEEDWDAVCEGIGCKWELPCLNKSRKDDDYRKYYTDELMQIVADRYSRDISLFGYNF